MEQFLTYFVYGISIWIIAFVIGLVLSPFVLLKKITINQVTVINGVFMYGTTFFICGLSLTLIPTLFAMASLSVLVMKVLKLKNGFNKS